MECRAGIIYLRASLEWMAGLYGFFLVWLCCGGSGTVELAMGGGLFFLFFLQFAVSSFGGLMSAVGIFVLRIFLLVALKYFLAVSYFKSC